MSDVNVENVRNFFKNSRISLQLPYKRHAKYYYLRSPLAVAYEEYVLEQTKLNCRVLSKSAVYRCLKGQFRVRKKYLSKSVSVTCVSTIAYSLML